MKYFPGWSLVFLLVVLFASPNVCYAKTAKEINANVDAAINRFEKDVPEGKDLLKKAKGVLVIPRVIKAGFIFGGEYGVGALRINGKTVDYYNIGAGSFGFQLGGEMKDVYLLFMDDTVLDKFRNSEGWKAGVDGSVAFMESGAGGSVDTTVANKPILGYVLGQKGLMFNLTLEGAKFNKIKPDEK